MKITIFHGSARLFNAFVIDPVLTITKESSLMEGVGIYLTDNKALAEGIGSYTYTVEVDTTDVTDMTSKKVIKEVIEKTINGVNPQLLKYVDLNMIVHAVKVGKISVVKLYKELEYHLDSTEAFHMQFGNQITCEEDCIFEKIKESYLSVIGNVLKYYDSGYEHDNYICFRNAECLIIRNIDELGL